MDANSSKKIKLFLGIPVAPDIALPLKAALQKSSPEVAEHARWTKPYHHHITMHFFGMVEEEGIGAIDAAVARVIESIKPMQLKSDVIAPFPKMHAPLIAAHVMHDKDLISLQAQIESAVVELGYKKEHRGYNPHITLCRIRKKYTENFLPLSIEGEYFTANSLVLYKSLSIDTGVLYVPLKSYNFKKD